MRYPVWHIRQCEVAISVYKGDRVLGFDVGLVKTRKRSSRVYGLELGRRQMSEKVEDASIKLYNFIPYLYILFACSRIKCKEINTPQETPWSRTLYLEVAGSYLVSYLPRCVNVLLKESRKQSSGVITIIDLK